MTLAIAALLVGATAGRADRESIGDPTGDLNTTEPYCDAGKDIRRADVDHAREGRLVLIRILTLDPITDVEGGQPPMVLINRRGPNDWNLDAWAQQGTKTWERVVNRRGVFTRSGRQIGKPKIYKEQARQGRILFGFTPRQIGGPGRFGWTVVLGCGSLPGEIDAAPDDHYSIHHTDPRRDRRSAAQRAP